MKMLALGGVIKEIQEKWDPTASVEPLAGVKWASPRIATAPAGGFQFKLKLVVERQWSR